MSRIPYDQFSKQYLEELLTPLGEVTVGKEVPGEARQVDVFFSPTAQNAVAPQIGLLSRFAEECLSTGTFSESTFSHRGKRLPTEAISQPCRVAAPSQT